VAAQSTEVTQAMTGLLSRRRGSSKLIEPPRDCLPSGDPLLVPCDSQSADTLGHEARGILSVLAFNLKGAGPKLSIIWDH